MRKNAGDIRNRILNQIEIPNFPYGPKNQWRNKDEELIYHLERSQQKPQVRTPNNAQFTRSDMKLFGEHCRIVMSKGMSEQAMNALLDTWVENKNKK